jgi:hypothetical protein
VDIATIAAMHLDAMRNRPASINTRPDMRFGVFLRLVQRTLDDGQLTPGERDVELRALVTAATQHEAEQPI